MNDVHFMEIGNSEMYLFVNCVYFVKIVKLNTLEIEDFAAWMSSLSCVYILCSKQKVE